MKTDLMAELRGLRPDDDGIESLWPIEQRDTVLHTVLSSERRPQRSDIRLSSARRPSRRPILAAIAVAAAVAALAAVPAALSSTDTPGAGRPGPVQPNLALRDVTLVALHRLAKVAAIAPTDARAAGQYLHMIVREEQSGPGDQGPLQTDMESWTSDDGQVWRRDVRTGANGSREVDTYLFPPGGNDVDYPTPQYLDTLPTDPGALAAFLNSHVSGSSSHEEAIFVAIGTMLRGGFAPPALRSAAVQVLAQLPHVSLGDATVDSQGRPAQEYDFIDESIRPGSVQALFFDPDTAQILEDELTATGGGSNDMIVSKDRSGSPVHTISGALHYTGSVLQADVVDDVPQDIRDAAVPQHG